MESLVNELAIYAEAYYRGNDADLETPPYQLQHIWEAFLKINEWRGWDRQSNLPALLSLSAIAQWAGINDYSLGQFELDVFTRLEGAYWEALTPRENSTLFKDLKTIIQAEKDNSFATVPIKAKKAK